MLAWLATSAKLANLLPHANESDKCVEASAKVSFEGAAFLTVAKD
jgi:hypothetical protein